jgi:hypothetical protein
MRHVIAHAGSGVAEGKLGKVAGADDQGAMEIREPEQMRRAFAGLDVLEGEVKHRFAAAVGMPDVPQHLQRGQANVDFARCDAKLRHKRMRVPARALRRSKTRHAVSQDVAAREAQTVECLGGDDPLSASRPDPGRDGQFVDALPRSAV